MASSYSIEDQAADLGIHRIHSLVLGDSRKEAHIPTRLSLPTPKRPVVGHGDSRHEDWNYENEQKRELLRIARRQNLTRYPHEMKPGQKQATSLSSMVAFPVIAKIRRLDSNYEDADTLTRKIAAWKTLKVEHVIRRPDGLGTGNAHRGGPNYRPIASFGQPKRSPPLHPRAVGDAAPGTSSFSPRKYLIPTAGSVAAAWQAAAMGKPFHPFALPGTSSISVGLVPVKPPVRTPTRKSIVGSPRLKTTAPPAEVAPKTVGGGTYADQMESTSKLNRFQIVDIKIGSDTSQGSRDSGPTYADQMQALQSTITSDHDPLKRVENISPKKSPKKTPVYPIPRRTEETSMWLSKSPPRQASQPPDERRWTGKLATANDPYFNQPPVHASPSAAPVVSLPQIPTSAAPLSIMERTAAYGENVQCTPAATTEPPVLNPSSISLTSAVFDVAEFFEPLDDAEDEDEEQRYDADPDRERRDLEINLRVNKCIAEAEEAVLAREILSPRTSERKTVQFAESANVIHEPVSDHALDGEVDMGHLEVLTKPLYLWDSFRDFVTVRTVTGFEKWVPVPGVLRTDDYVGVDIAEEVEVRVVDREKGKFEHLGQTDANDDEPGAMPPPAEPKGPTDNEDVDPPVAGEPVRQRQEPGRPVEADDLPSAPGDAQTGPFATDIQIPNGPGVTTMNAWESSFGSHEIAQQDSTSPPPRGYSSSQIVPPIEPIETPETPRSVHALIETKSSAPLARPDCPPPAQPLETTLTDSVCPPTPGPMAKKFPGQMTQVKLPFPIRPSVTVAPSKRPPVNVMNEFESSEVANIWTKPIPLARVGLVAKVSHSREKDKFGTDAAASDEFLLGLDQSMKAEPTPKSVTIVDTKSGVDVEAREGDEIVEKKTADITETTVVTPPNVQSQGAPSSHAHTPHAAPPTPAKEVDIKPQKSGLQMPSTHSYSSMAGPIPSLSRPMISSPSLSTTFPIVRSPRSGIPMPIPIPPTPRPAMKSPPKKLVQPSISTASATIESRAAPSYGSTGKLAIAPKPAKLAGASKKVSLISPLVGGLVDPFLQGLEPKAKRNKSGPLPQTPGGSASASSSAESSPSKSFGSESSAVLVGGEDVSADLSGSGSTDLSRVSPSPVSLSGSWTLDENSKGSAPTTETPLGPPPTPAPKEVLAPVFQAKQSPPSAPIRRTWFSSSEPSPTPAPTPVPTPSATPKIHAALPSFVNPTPKPTREVTAPAPRKLFTFELKVGETVVSTPVYETDNPRVVAREFARKHDFENRLPGGKGTVDKIVSYFENQFTERKEEREKRRAERQMKNSLK